MSQDPQIRILHDHSHLMALLQDLDRALVIWSAADRISDEQESGSLPDIREILELLKDDTFEHFEREEHGLFPNLRESYPHLDEEIAGLHRAHDEICEAIEALERQLQTAKDGLPESRARAVAAGQRLGQLYWSHTAVEWEMIRNLLDQLDERQRAVIVEQLKEI